MADLAPSDIQLPGNAVDPGIRASPAVIRDPRGDALSSFARDMSVVSATFNKLQEQRQTAEDSGYVDAYQLALSKDAAQIEAESLNSDEIAHPNFVDNLDKKLEAASNEVQDRVIKEGGFTPSDAGRTKANEVAMNMRISTARSATAKAHNQRVESLLTSADASLNEVARRAADNGDVDGGMAQVDVLIDSLKGVVAPDKAAVLRKAARQTVFESVVEGHLARKEYDQAQSLVDAETGFYKQPEKPPTLEYPQAAGLVEKGNVDLNNRPSVKMDGGKIATIRSMSFEEDGKEILVPTVSDDGRILTDQQAIDLYHNTGKHLGKFNNAAEADAYAQVLHNDQNRRYGGGVGAAIFAAATDAGVDPAVALGIAQIESNLDPMAKPKIDPITGERPSKAAGLNQFIPKTAVSLGLPADASTASVEEQARAGAQLLAANTAALHYALGGAPSPAELYLAHFLGSGDAIQVLRADEKTDVSTILSSDVMTANPFLKGMTAADLHQWAAKKMQDGMSAAAGSIDGRKIDAKTAILPISDAIALSKRVAGARRDQKVDMTGLIKDDVASIKATGKPIGIDENVAHSVMTPKEMGDWQGDREDARQYFDATHDMVSLPADAIQGRVDALQPRAGEVGFARAEKVHDEVRKEADRITKQRTEDPAQSVYGVDAVAAARAAYDPAKPNESWHALISARIEAQKSVGIPPDLQAVLTKEEVRRWAGSIKNAPPDEFFNRFEALSKSMEAHLGDFADEALKQVVGEFVRGEDAQASASRIIKNLIDRQAVPVSDAKAFDNATENANVDGITKSLSEEEQTMQMLRRDPNWQEGQRRAAEDAISGKGPTLLHISPDQEAIQYLQAHPESLDDFISVYGADQVPPELMPARQRRGRR